jgi:glutathione synthase|tara:strand:- start:82 stop:1002 length:921 start_codon:yes stop_codon:yes gene_type:complete
MQKKILAIQGSSLTRVNIETDTTLFLALEAQKRGYQIYYFEPKNLSFLNSRVIAKCFHLTFFENTKKFYKINKKLSFNLSKAKVLLIRNEPPFNQQYINTTFILEHLTKKVKIINHPKSIREVPEKLFSMRFGKYMPSTLISENLEEIKNFFKLNKKVIVKPINSYSGNEVLLLNSFNSKIITGYIKKHNHIIFQKFLPKISKGDKRVFIINGMIKGSITRVPKKGSILSNMSKGAIAKKSRLTKKEMKISKQVAILLKQKNIYFAGIDFVQGHLIGDINVTSPTGLATHYSLTKVNLAKYFWDNL